LTCVRKPPQRLISNLTRTGRVMNVLRTIKLWQKFGILGALGAVACAIPTDYFLV